MAQHNTTTRLMLGVSSAALAFTLATHAQAQAQAPAAEAVQVEEVIVTGSRIVRDGYQAPTPVTVVATDTLEKTAPGSIPDGLNQLPQFANSRGASNPGASATSPAAGNYLNLRGLGVIRGLVLLDGQRVPPTSFDGTVDTNIIPQLLIQRVDVVTGGASAAYGSDAVSGVINFVLDTGFNGVKGVAQAGVSSRGDDRSWRAGVAFGTKFQGGRGHLLFSGEHYERDGLPDQEHSRIYGDEGWLTVGAGTVASPRREVRDTRFITGNFGGVIVGNNASANPGNPLRNYYFAPGGALVPFNPGTPSGTSNINIGGDGSPIIGHTLTGSIRTDQLFGRVDYDLTPNIKAFAQLTFGESFNRFTTVGSGTQLGDFRMFTENPYLPVSAKNTMEAAGITSFTMGRISRDLNYKWVNTLNDVYTFLSGVSGTLGDYKWKATYGHGDSLVRVSHFGNLINRNWYAALDAVRGPNGNIVCRITVTNPGLQDDCIPINVFGDGSPTKAANDYVMGVSQYQISQKMDNVAAEFSGDLFQLPAGPLAFAAGAEYRKQSLDENTNSDPATPVSLVGLRTNVSTYLNRTASTNVGKAAGEYNVKEVFAETAVPILKDAPFAKSLELNGAARYTDYSTSGGVTTWKVGVNYSPIEELRFRYTRSKDIRAPTLYELFAGDQAGRGPFNDLHTGLLANVVSLSSGNPDLQPEEGNTYTAGVVWQPSYIPGLTASIDYYDIKITNAITNLDLDRAQQECEASNGASPLCQYIIRPFGFADRSPANFPTATRQVPFNQAKSYLHGIDYDVSYRLPLDRIFDGSDGRVDFRLIGGYNPSRKAQAGATSAITQTANTGGTPQHRINLSANYSDGPLAVNLQARYIGKTQRTRDPAIIFVKNDIPAVTYFDTTVSYKFEVSERNFEAFLTVNNLLDKKPPLVPVVAGQPGISYPTVQALFDVVGRYYTTGLRFKF
ncbi:MAG: TonB-dependent receptor [Caulobacter sp.]|nr:TonB-dependent receptor [Caulobacter sp.]